MKRWWTPPKLHWHLLLLENSSPTVSLLRALLLSVLRTLIHAWCALVLKGRYFHKAQSSLQLLLPFFFHNQKCISLVGSWWHYSRMMTYWFWIVIYIKMKEKVQCKAKMRVRLFFCPVCLWGENSAIDWCNTDCILHTFFLIIFFTLKMKKVYQNQQYLHGAKTHWWIGTANQKPKVFSMQVKCHIIF